jgi:hypothetical protein
MGMTNINFVFHLIRPCEQERGGKLFCNSAYNINILPYVSLAKKANLNIRRKNFIFQWKLPFFFG